MSEGHKVNLEASKKQDATLPKNMKRSLMIAGSTFVSHMGCSMFGADVARTFTWTLEYVHIRPQEVKVYISFLAGQQSQRHCLNHTRYFRLNWPVTRPRCNLT